MDARGTATYRFILNHANGAGFYDQFPEVAELARRWGTEFRRPGDAHSYLLTEVDADPARLFLPRPDETGGPIELLSIGSGPPTLPAATRAADGAPGRMRVETRSFPATVTDPGMIIDALRGAGLRHPVATRPRLRAAYLLSVSPTGREWRRLLRPVFENPDGSDWVIELLQAPEDPGDASRERTEATRVRAVGASDFRPTSGF